MTKTIKLFLLITCITAAFPNPTILAIMGMAVIAHRLPELEQQER